MYVAFYSIMLHLVDHVLMWTTDDGKRLQENLTELTKWAEKWQMTFHPFNDMSIY
jgi:DNA-binding HxlR family transcriptional regulator